MDEAGIGSRDSVWLDNGDGRIALVVNGHELGAIIQVGGSWQVNVSKAANNTVAIAMRPDKAGAKECLTQYFLALHRGCH